LLVDDNELNRRAGKLLIEKLGHLVQIAIDGPDALDKYQLDETFDLVLIDVQMPGMDGFETTARLREIQDRIGNRCPIIALTASAMASDRKRWLEAGFDDHLARPIRTEDLAAMINKLVANEVESLGTEAQEWCRTPDEILQTLPISDSEIVEIIQLFRENCVSQVDLMNQAILEGNPLCLSRAAHGLMGCLAIFGTPTTVAYLAELEQAGRAEQLDGTRSMLSKLEVAIAGMQPTFDHLLGSLKPEPDVAAVGP
jgi:CheY-like chemotaxis protein/HPt (histidine-containing phosphotransfer) domain-containing protein